MQPNQYRSCNPSYVSRLSHQIFDDVQVEASCPIASREQMRKALTIGMPLVVAAILVAGGLSVIGVDGGQKAFAGCTGASGGSGASAGNAGEGGSTCSGVLGNTSIGGGGQLTFGFELEGGFGGGGNTGFGRHSGFGNGHGGMGRSGAGGG